VGSIEGSSLYVEYAPTKAYKRSTVTASATASGPQWGQQSIPLARWYAGAAACDTNRQKQAKGYWLAAMQQLCSTPYIM
jgi:hypothetical protein